MLWPPDRLTAMVTPSQQLPLVPQVLYRILVGQEDDPFKSVEGVKAMLLQAHAEALPEGVQAYIEQQKTQIALDAYSHGLLLEDFPLPPNSKQAAEVAAARAAEAAAAAAAAGQQPAQPAQQLQGPGEAAAAATPAAPGQQPQEAGPAQGLLQQQQQPQQPAVEAAAGAAAPPQFDAQAMAAALAALTGALPVGDLGAQDQKALFGLPAGMAQANGVAGGSMDVDAQGDQGIGAGAAGAAPMEGVEGGSS